MADYRAINSVPALVKRALNLAEQMKYESSCTDETGRFLQLIASQFQSGVIGELGTGCGVASAWIVSSLSPSTTFFTIEKDSNRAAAARALFDPLLNVRVIQGDWREFLQNWRFLMLYAGIGSPRDEDPQALLQSLRTGGLIILDGLIPRNRLPASRRNRPDPLREFWLNDSRILATEVQVSPVEAVILATRSE